jgi:hypothetical protein
VFGSDAARITEPGETVGWSSKHLGEYFQPLLPKQFGTGRKPRYVPARPSDAADAPDRSANRASAKAMDQAMKEAGAAVQLMVQRVSGLELPAAKLDDQMTAFSQGLESVLSRLTQTIDELGHASGRRHKRRWWRLWR